MKLQGRKYLLCIAPSGIDSQALLGDAMHDWNIHSVKTLAEGERELRSGHYLVGLIMYVDKLRQLMDLDAFLRRHGDIQWVAVCNQTDLENASYRDVVLEHLCDYHTFPIDPMRLAHTLGHAHGWGMLRQCVEPNRARLGSHKSPLVGNSEAIELLRSQIDRISKVSAPVLIWGESGSGKELVAHAIHTQSDRAAGPFVPINCGAIAPSLIHSELFGYERGAFTGATRGKAGLIESANGGTLFLDEIGDLPKDMQANLLRFLQENTICRLGSTRNIQVDVRVVAASHVQLQQAVADGVFREDLYYRLAVLPVTVPPLRERRDDLVTLAEHFFHMYSSEKSARLKGFSSRAIAAIVDHDWPGNVRELINRVRRALVMSDSHLIMPEDLDLGTEANPSLPVALDDIRTGSERSTLHAALQRSGHNISRAARDLGISRTTIYRLLGKHGMPT